MVWFVVVSSLALGSPLTIGEADDSHRVDAIDELAIEPLDSPQGAIPTTAPWEPPGGIEAPRRPQQLGDKILYVNFDGADLNFCNNSSPIDNCSTIYGGLVDPYSGDAGKRAAVIQVVRRRVEAVGITVTDQRPQSGDYDMEVVGNWAGQTSQELGFAGIAPSIDCFDNRGGETSFTLEASGTADGISEIILQELAHTWGLEHVDDQGDLLYPTTQGTNKIFKDECLKIVRLDDQGLTQPVNGQCNQMHTNFCEFGFQNSAQELLQLFGPSFPDTAAPTIQILAPADGDTLEGGDVDLVIGFVDDQSPQIINTTITLESAALETPVEEDGAFAAPSELTFPLAGLPDGDYVVTIDGRDESDNPASDSISFTIVGGEPQGGSDGSGGSDTGDSDSDGSGGTGGSSDGSGGGDSGDDSDGDTDTDGAGADGGADDSGCGCTTEDAAPRGGLLMLALLGPALLRRRRA